MKFILHISFILFFNLLWSQDISTELSLSDSLVAFYPFEGNANDVINGNDGIIYGASLTDDRFGIPDNAYYFGGYDYIEVPYDSLLDIRGSITISVWAKGVASESNRSSLSIAGLVCKANVAPYGIGVDDGDRAVFQVFSDNIFYKALKEQLLIHPEEWYHYVGVYKASEYVKLYINGELVSEYYENIPKEIDSSSNALWIGTRSVSTDPLYPRYFFNGTIDDIRIYNRALNEKEITYLYEGALNADFTADTLTGTAPLTVHFTDKSFSRDSLIEIKSWKWDFNNDGIIDSEEQNPEWTYEENGIYSVSLIVSDSLNSDAELKKNYITVLSEAPFIFSIQDVPDDQGGWVKVKFLRSIYDTDTLQNKAESSELYTIEIDDGSGWTAATSLTAYNKLIYSALVHTTKDSTLYDNGLIHFRVIAAMEEGNYVSNIVSGYSIDNLVPSVPEGIQAALYESNAVKITWDKSPDEDFNYFNIYRNTENLFDENAQPIYQTSKNSFVDRDVEIGKNYYYSLRAVDHSYNMSNYSNAVSVNITSIGNNDKNIPDTYFLEQNYPNPFNPTTTISYGLPEKGTVEIIIYDITGREIRKLIDKNQEAGKYIVSWDALNNAGEKVSSGVYLYKIKAGTFVKVNKMILVR